MTKIKNPERGKNAPKKYSVRDPWGRFVKKNKLEQGTWKTSQYISKIDLQNILLYSINLLNKKDNEIYTMSQLNIHLSNEFNMMIPLRFWNKQKNRTWLYDFKNDDDRLEFINWLDEGYEIIKMLIENNIMKKTNDGSIKERIGALILKTNYNYSEKVINVEVEGYQDEGTDEIKIKGPGGEDLL